MCDGGSEMCDGEGVMVMCDGNVMVGVRWCVMVRVRW